MLRDILMSYGLLYIEISAKTGQPIEYIKGSIEDIQKAFQEFDKKNISISRVLDK